MIADGEKRGAIVLDGNSGALGIVRSLGRHNIPVWALVDAHRLAAFSRYCTRAVHWPDASDSDKVKWLKGLGRSHQLYNWVLFPASDETARLVSLHRKALTSHYGITTPDWDVMRWAYDKRLPYQLAASLGLSHARTFLPRDRSEVESLNCEFPVILKPAYKRRVNRFTHSKAWLVKDRGQLLALYDDAAVLVGAGMVIVQELIAGGGENQFSFACLYIDGYPVASLTARRTRQYPIDFGYSSSLVETVNLPEIEIPAKRLLRSLRYSGVAEVEFKYDYRDSKYKLLEINPRFWTWHSLGSQAGVDFPYLVWQIANGQTITEAHALTGVKWVHMLVDLAAAIGEISSGRLSLLDYFRSLSGISQFAIFSRDDPLPALLEPTLLLLSRASRLGRRVRARWGPGKISSRCGEDADARLLDAPSSIQEMERWKDGMAL
jgi:D-aspartate ligase